jgi:hypothetical protein
VNLLVRCTVWMSRFGRALFAGLLLASMGATSVLSETQFCVAVAEDQPACPRVPEPELTATTGDQDFAAAPLEVAPIDTAPTETAPADQPAITTRTVGPSVVVQGFGAVAAPQSAMVEEPLVRTRQPDQKLPPGPPSRFP